LNGFGENNCSLGAGTKHITKELRGLDMGPIRWP